MKFKLLIYFCVAILPTIINGIKTLTEYSFDVEEIAQTKGALINGLFKPSAGGFMGNGSFGFTYQGMMLPIEKVIVMKFTTMKRRKVAEKEYEIYSYLNAINNGDVERYGIPAVYYYGKWNANDLIMMGFSLLDTDISKLRKSKQLFEHDVNVLIVLRDFILTSKYIHMRGVRHNDVKLTNMMVRKHRTFLIDFNLATKLNDKSSDGTHKYASREAHGKGLRYAKDDWESFLYSMCSTLGIQFDWFGEEPKNMLQFKLNTSRTMSLIKTLGSPTLRNVFVQFAEHVFETDVQCQFEYENLGSEFGKFSLVDNVDSQFPQYERFYKLVNAEIQQFNLKKPVMFSWLRGDDRNEAIADLDKYKTPDIDKMHTLSYTESGMMFYEPVDLGYFERCYNGWTPSMLQINRCISRSSSRGKRTSNHIEASQVMDNGKKMKGH